MRDVGKVRRTGGRMDGRRDGGTEGRIERGMDERNKLSALPLSTDLMSFMFPPC